MNEKTEFVVKDEFLKGLSILDDGTYLVLLLQKIAQELPDDLTVSVDWPKGPTGPRPETDDINSI